MAFFEERVALARFAMESIIPKTEEPQVSSAKTYPHWDGMVVDFCVSG